MRMLVPAPGTCGRAGCRGEMSCRVSSDVGCSGISVRSWVLGRGEDRKGGDYVHMMLKTSDVKGEL